jgi:hypothetical protein
MVLTGAWPVGIHVRGAGPRNCSSNLHARRFDLHRRTFDLRASSVEQETASTTSGAR